MSTLGAGRTAPDAPQLPGYLIDSDWMIDLTNGDAIALRLIESFAPARIAVSIVSYMETYQGVFRQPLLELAQAQLRQAFSPFVILPLSVAVAERCARVRHDLSRRGLRVNSRALDLIIAATAMEYGLTLVTRNLPDYRHIPGLALYQET